MFGFSAGLILEDRGVPAPELPVPPVATSFAVSVSEGAVTAIDLKVAGRITFSGPASALTITFPTPPTGGDTALDAGNGVISYTAVAVTGNQVRSVGYRVANANGQSGIGTITVTVIDVAPADAYAAIVNGITSANLVGWWRHGDANVGGGLADSGPNRLHGTFPATPEAFAVAGLTTAASDGKAINYGGNGYAQVEDDAVLHLAAGTKFIKFRVNALPATGQATIWSKDETGIFAGDTTMYVNSAGQLRAVMGDGTQSLERISAAGALVPGTTYAGCLRWDGTGFDLNLNGVVIGGGKNTGWGGGWVDNTAPLMFAKASFNTILTDIVLDESILFDGVITDADVRALSEVVAGTAPVARDDPGISAVAGGAQIVIPVANNDTFTGPRASLVFTFNTAGTAGTGIAKNANGDVVYTPPATAQVDDFSYTIQDTGGTSGSATVTINVAAAGGDPLRQVVVGIPNLVAYWRMGDTQAATLADSSGNGRNGTYPTAPLAFQAATMAWQQSDNKAVNFGGSGYGQVAHNAAFATARGTLCGYFRANTLATPQTFVNKGTGFVLEALTTGALELTFGATTIASAAGVIVANTDYHIAVLWDQVAIWLVVDGRVVRWTRAHTTGLTANAAAWQFGRTTGGANSNVRIDEVALYSRRVTWAELDDLSENIRGLPYNPTPEDTVLVNTVAELETALTVGGGQPGLHILVAAGNYPGVNVTIPVGRSGARRRPIVVRPQGGTVSMPGASFICNNSWMVFDGFTAHGLHIELNPGSRYMRVTRILNSTPTRRVVEMLGRFARVDHCDFSGTVGARIIHLVPSGAGNSFYNLIDHNHFHDAPRVTGNGFEAIGLGGQPEHHNLFAATTMYRNRFNSWVAEGEITSAKCTGNLFLGNTVLASNEFGGVTYCGRHGPQSWLESEWYDQVGGIGGGGVRILGENNVIIGCQVSRCGIRLWTGDVTAAAYTANPLQFAKGPYPACATNLIIGCDIGAQGSIVVGHQQVTAYNVPVTGTQIDQTTDCTINQAFSNNTVQNPAARIPFTAAVALGAGAVGTGAADPLVPTGFK